MLSSGKELTLKPWGKSFLPFYVWLCREGLESFCQLPLDKLPHEESHSKKESMMPLAISLT